MLDLYLIRHPPTNSSAGNIIQGSLVDEDPKDGYGHNLEDIAAKLAKEGTIDAVVTSHLKRARKPAHELFELLLNYGQNPDYISTPALNERNWGALNGKPYEQVVSSSDPEALRRYLFDLAQIENGEGHKDIRRRLMEFDQWYIQPIVQRNGDKATSLVILSHQFLLTHMRYFYTRGDVAAGPYEPWPNLGVRHLRIDGKPQENQRAMEIPF